MRRGKRRAIAEIVSEASTSSVMLPTTSGPMPAKKPKRAETRPCPVCNENIPVRLLPVHSELEMERVEYIMRNIGSTEVLADRLEEGSSSRDRRSAARARKTLNQRLLDREDTLTLSNKTIQAVKRHRKQRHTRLRESTRDEDDSWTVGNGEEVAVCPVCSQMVGGDQDVVEAHIDACLAHQSIAAAQEDNERASQDESVLMGSVTPANLRAMGFDVRNQNEEDVDDDVDVDGDDEAVFGHAQFTEGDILLVDSDPVGNGRESDADPGGTGEEDGDLQNGTESLRGLVAKGKVPQRSQMAEKMEGKAPSDSDEGSADITIASARKSGDPSSHICALENKVKQTTQVFTSTHVSSSPLCRICIDLYTEPTVSTGCWHTCCKECWLRCLGSTKLCPICKRITAATELRRIYL